MYSDDWGIHLVPRQATFALRAASGTIATIGDSPPRWDGWPPRPVLTPRGSDQYPAPGRSTWDWSIDLSIFLAAMRGPET